VRMLKKWGHYRTTWVLHEPMTIYVTVLNQRNKRSAKYLVRMNDKDLVIPDAILRVI
jgi:hypothetical protein